MVGFSIVICSYCPNTIIFERLLKSVQNLIKPNDVLVEVIIVDNNSIRPLNSYLSVQEFVSSYDNVKCVVEKNRGLTSARMRGFKESQYDWLIFFDDDNEPDQNYITELKKVINNYPNVMCWGQAQITVEFIDPNIDPWIFNKKNYFQERDWPRTKFGSSFIWQDYYPYGTGLVVHRKVMEEYERRLKSGVYNLSDRVGKSLSSGGDLQIVLTSVSSGYNAGTVRGMKINHIIEKKKSNFHYLVKLSYGTASAYVAAHLQVNPSLKFNLHTSSNFEIILHITKIIITNFRKKYIKDIVLMISEYMGSVNARYAVFNS